ncbi:hypothetical protein MD484_g7030, partial [Candolleomyces efflorescens]
MADGHDYRWLTRETTPLRSEYLLFAYEAADSIHQKVSTEYQQTEYQQIKAAPNNAQSVFQDFESEGDQFEPSNRALYVRNFRIKYRGKPETVGAGFYELQNPNPISESINGLFCPYNPLKNPLELIAQSHRFFGGPNWWSYPIPKSTCGFPDIEWPAMVLPGAHFEFQSIPDSSVPVIIGHSWEPKMDVEIASLWSIPERARDPKTKRGNLGRFSNFLHFFVFENLPESGGGVEFTLSSRNTISLTGDELSKGC